MNEEKVLKNIQSKNFVIPFTTILLIIFCFLFVLFVKDSQKIERINVDNCIKTKDTSYQYYVDELYYEDSNIYLKKDIVKMSGWFAKPNEKTDDVSIKVVFKNMNDGIYYQMPTLMISRPEVSSFVGDGYNHQYSGFSMNVEYSRLDKNADYKIYLLYSLNGKDYLVDLNRTLKTSGEKRA